MVVEEVVGVGVVVEEVLGAGVVVEEVVSAKTNPVLSAYTLLSSDPMKTVAPSRLSAGDENTLSPVSNAHFSIPEAVLEASANATPRRTTYRISLTARLTFRTISLSSALWHLGGALFY